jgi:hypothetical protein
MDASNPLNGETSPAPKSLMRLKQLAAILVLLLVSPLAFAGEVTFLSGLRYPKISCRNGLWRPFGGAEWPRHAAFQQGRLPD